MNPAAKKIKMIFAESRKAAEDSWRFMAGGATRQPVTLNLTNADASASGFNGLCETVDLSEDAVLTLAENGLLTPVWNIGACTNNRRELRFLTVSLIYYAATKRPLPADPDAIASDLLPLQAEVTTVSLGRTLNCGSDLVCDLVKANALALEPGQTLKCGRSPARVSRKSALAFLEARLCL